MPERQIFETVDAALRTYHWWPKENLDVIRDTISDLTIRSIYTPPGRSYIGLSVEGSDTIVAINYGFIDGLLDDDGKKYWVRLPVNRITDAERNARRDFEQDICPYCTYVLPLSGRCDCRV